MKVAVLIGINYIGQDGELNGCINDIHNVKNVLITKYGYLEENIRVLTDLSESNEMKPTKQNILNELNNLVLNTQMSECWVHYSGHGTYISDRSRDESDRRDECLCPLDYSSAGLIVDDDLCKIFQKMKLNVKCTVFFDACHSGTALDLPFLYNTLHNVYTTQNRNVFNANIVFISGCLDNQTSADAYISNQSQGAMTASLLTTLEQFNYTISISNLVKNMRVYLKNNYFTQVPQLCLSNKKISVRSNF
jgi:hypothetical protein